jgi:peptide deformylase
MYEAKGVGLAANQVDLPIRLFIINLQGDPAKSEEELVFINPVTRNPKGSEEGEEGCLSLPGLYGPVTRPKSVKVIACNLRGEQFEAEISGLFARVVQHELDHLDGVLFTDRMSETARTNVRPTLLEFEAAFQRQRESGEISNDDEIRARLAEYENRYC